MGIDLGGLADKAKDLVNEHGDKIEEGVEKAGEFAKTKFGHGEQIDQVIDKVKDLVPGEYGDDVPRGEPLQGEHQQGDGRQQG